MKWTLHPKSENYSTTLPLTIEIESSKGNPRVFVQGLGELELKKQENKYKSEFYFSLPGTYQVQVSDDITTQVRELIVEEHQYLDFTNEFGFFSVLFLLVMGGIILWTKKIMQKKMP